MSGVFDNLGLFASQNLLLAYFIVYVSTIFLGNISAFTSFWFAFQGGLGPFGVPFVILAVFLAHITGDLLWYSMGRTLRETRFGNWVRRRLPGHEKIEAHIERRGKRWMIFSKFVYGSNFPIVFSIGWMKIDFKKFFKNSLLAVSLWLPILIGLSYALFSSLSPLRAVATFKNFEEVFLIALVLFLVFDYLLVKVVRKIFKNGNGVDEPSQS